MVSTATLAAQTTTTEVARVVGEPLPEAVPYLAGALLLGLIVAGAAVLRRRTGVVDRPPAAVD